MTNMVRSDLTKFVEDYGNAWNAHDLASIMAMHTADTVFRLHMLAAPEIVGVEQVEAAFSGMLNMWPDIHFETRSVEYGSEFLVQSYDMTATLAAPMYIGNRCLNPMVSPVTLSGVDILSFDGNLVRRKETYLDLAHALVELGAL